MQNVGLVGEGHHSELTGCTFEVHLRGKPGIVEEIPKGLRQKMFSSHIVSQESEERWVLGKRLGREGSSNAQEKPDRGNMASG